MVIKARCLIYNHACFKLTYVNPQCSVVSSDLMYNRLSSLPLGLLRSATQLHSL